MSMSGEVLRLNLKEGDTELHPINRHLDVEIQFKNMIAQAKITGRILKTDEGVKIVLHNTQGMTSVKKAIDNLNIVFGEAQGE